MSELKQEMEYILLSTGMESAQRTNVKDLYKYLMTVNTVAFSYTKDKEV